MQFIIHYFTRTHTHKKTFAYVHTPHAGHTQLHCLRNEAVVFIDPSCSVPFADSSPVCNAVPTKQQHKQHKQQQHDHASSLAGGANINQVERES